jgi:hypothetical protein
MLDYAKFLVLLALSAAFTLLMLALGITASDLL